MHNTMNIPDGHGKVSTVPRLPFSPTSRAAASETTSRGSGLFVVIQYGANNYITLLLRLKCKNGACRVQGGINCKTKKSEVYLKLMRQAMVEEQQYSYLMVTVISFTGTKQTSAE